MAIIKKIEDRLSQRLISRLSADQLKIMAAAKEDRRTGGSGEAITDKLEELGRTMLTEDLKSWKTARNSALNVINPRRSRLIATYESLMLDNHLSSVIETRILQVTAAKFKVVDEDGEDDEEARDLFTEPWFEDFIWYAMESVFWGPVVIELYDQDEEGLLNTIRKVGMRHVIPDKHMIVKNPMDQNGWDYMDDIFKNYYIQVGKSSSLGALDNVAAVAFYKKFAFAAWSEFVERFGIPPMYAVVSHKDDKRKRDLFTHLKNMAMGMVGVFHDDEELRHLDVKQTDAFKVFNELIERCNTEISKKILGATGTVDTQSSGGTYAQSKVHAEVAGDRHEADRTMIKYLVNRELIPRLIELGYPLEGRSFEWDDSRELTIDEQVSMWKELSSFVNIDPDYITEHTGIPVSPKAQGMQPPEPGTGGPTNRLKKNFTKLSDRLNALYHHGHDHGHEIRAELGEVPEQLSGSMERILRELHEGKISQSTVDAQLYTLLSNAFQKGLMEPLNVNLSQVDYDSPDNQAIHLMRNNVYQFSAAKSLSMMKQLQAEMLTEEGNLKSFSWFKRDAEKITKQYNDNWLKAEYQHAVGSSQMGAQWRRYEENKDVMPYLTYQTVGDDRVREAHRAMDGITRPVDSPFWDENYPLNGYRCRCDAIQTNNASNLTDPEEADNIAASVDVDPFFKNNVGKTNVIYRDNHPYFQDVDGSINELDAEKNYRMKPVSKIYSDPNKLPADQAESFNDTWDDLHKRKQYDEESIALKDWRGHSLRVTRNSLNQSEKAVNLEDTLSNPSEVWNQANDTYYVKYYQNSVATLQVDDQLNAKSFRAYSTNDDLKGIRKGILMKR